jgi:hypothetical protein
MKYRLFIIFMIAFFVTTTQVWGFTAQKKQNTITTQTELVDRRISLEKRYSNKFVNDVFKDNILLTLSYMTGKVKKTSDINWNDVIKDAQYEIVLQPGEVFAFHDDVLPEYKGKVIKTTNVQFDASYGFKTDGYLYGDGVCHLASLMNWAARDAGLKVVAPTNHDFAIVPEIDRKYGTAIYTTPGESQIDKMQNLYITNSFDKPVRMVFTYKDKELSAAVYK